MIHHQVKILYIQHQSFGDVLVSTAIIRKLKEAHANSLLDYYTTTVCAPLIIGNPDINRIYTERYAPQHIENYDILLRPYRCLQMTGGWHLSGKHFMDLYAEVCGVTLNGDYRTFFKNFEEVPPPAPKYILIHCKTNDPSKDYDRFPEVVSAIRTKLKLPVFQLSGEKDPIIPGITGRLRETWPKVAHYISKAVTTVCLDSAPQHLAGSIGSPYIALFGPKDMHMVRSGVVVDGGKTTGTADYQFGLEPLDRNDCPEACHLAQCHNKKGKCINNITPDQIIELIDKTIQKG